MNSRPIRLKTTQRSQMIEITDVVREFVARAKVNDGIVVVYVPHTTAGVTINENADPDVRKDMLRKLDLLVPRDEAFYQHAEGNSDSHVKASMMGSSVTVVLDGDGDLVLGRWQGIYFCEFDGPRDDRSYIVKVLADGGGKGE